MPKLFWGQPANGSLLVQLNFMTSKACAQVFLITQELCKVQGAGSGTGPHHKFFSAACQWLLCSTRVSSCTILCSLFPRGDYCGLCSVFLRTLQRWLQWRSPQYNLCPQRWLLWRAPSCPSCHQRHRLTHAATTHSVPWNVFATQWAMRLWGVFQTQLSFCVRCRGILAGWRITSILPQGKQGKEKLA